MCRGPFTAAHRIWKNHSRSSSLRELRQLGRLFSKQVEANWSGTQVTLPEIADQNDIAALAAS